MVSIKIYILIRSLMLTLMTRAQRKKLKLTEDNDMMSYMEDPSKLFTMCSMIMEQSREQLGVKLAKFLKGATQPPMVAPCLLLPVLHDEVILGRIWIQINKKKRIHIKMALEKPPI
ncbi:hypothetical protein M9H77_35472 [Catharanthus roseus]|uniref:Uncharacterized protein n=1 Tax=Catharanthus roseus TaxID=4058 RepID=A0ACB9ZRA1_CATRO|nr:hypothetical protein M9H77_35472 [Catharanthus roseus]